MNGMSAENTESFSICEFEENKKQSIEQKSNVNQSVKKAICLVMSGTSQKSTKYYTKKLLLNFS